MSKNELLQKVCLEWQKKYEAERQKAKVLRKKLKDTKIKHAEEMEKLIRGQAQEMVKSFTEGYHKGEIDRDAIYSASFGRAGLKAKVADRISAKVKQICLEITKTGTFKQKQEDYKPLY